MLQSEIAVQEKQKMFIRNVSDRLSHSSESIQDLQNLPVK